MHFFTVYRIYISILKWSLALSFQYSLVFKFVVRITYTTVLFLIDDIYGVQGKILVPCANGQLPLDILICMTSTHGSLPSDRDRPIPPIVPFLPEWSTLYPVIALKLYNKSNLLMTNWLQTHTHRHTQRKK